MTTLVQYFTEQDDVIYETKDKEDTKTFVGDNGIFGVEIHALGGDDHIFAWTADWDAGTDRFFGGDGEDTINYLNSDGRIHVNLAHGTTESGVEVGRAQLLSLFGEKTHKDFIYDIENVRGTFYHDILQGNTQDNEIYGYSGDDHIEGRDGDDTIKGHEGEDNLYGGAGDDHMEGGDDDDDMWGGDDNDVMFGDAGDDVMYGDFGNDVMFGGAGDNWLSGGTGDDFISVGERGFAWGGIGDDTIQGGNFNDVLQGFKGEDVIYGAGGNDDIHGGDDDDALYGDGGDDTLNGGEGENHIDGGSGHDTAVFDGLGNMTIELDANGNGTASYGGFASGGSGGAVGGKTNGGGDGLFRSGGIGQFATEGGDAAAGIVTGAKISTLVSIEEIHTGDGHDDIVTMGGDDRVLSGGGNDAVSTGFGDDYVEGGDGDDFIETGFGADYAAGGAGDDEIDGGEGDDFLAGGTGSNVIRGGAGDDVMHGSGGWGNDGETAFAYEFPDTGTDTIWDFELGTDTFDFGFGFLGGGGSPSDSVVAYANPSGDTLLFADRGASWQHFATLKDVDAADVQSAIADGSLFTDHIVVGSGGAGAPGGLGSQSLDQDAAARSDPADLIGSDEVTGTRLLLPAIQGRRAGRVTSPRREREDNDSQNAEADASQVSFAQTPIGESDVIGFDLIDDGGSTRGGYPTGPIWDIDDDIASDRGPAAIGVSLQFAFGQPAAAARGADPDAPLIEDLFGGDLFGDALLFA